MVQKLVVKITDDIDGSAAETTVRFGLAGADYEIDLSRPHADELAEVMRPFIQGARKVPGPGRRRQPAAAPAGPAARADQSAVRTWARSQGIEISERGRIAQTVIDAYAAAQHPERD